MNPKAMLTRLAKLFSPVLKPVFGWAKRYYDLYKLLMPDWGYNAWANTHKNYCYVEKEIRYKPLISVLVPVYNPTYTHLLQTVYSVVNQHYDNWELILVNGSSIPKLREQTKTLEQIDIRIKVVNIPENLGISKNTNIAIKHASGEFIALFDHDDLMHPCALHSAVEAMQSKKVPDLIYTDEDKITNDNERYFNPHCKPDWSPDLIRNVNYITHLVVVRRKMVERVNGFRPECDGAQDYDLVLRVVDECKPIIKHVPRILYSWRSTAQSTAGQVSAKPYITNAGILALRDHIKRNDIPAKAHIIDGKPGFYELVYAPTDFSIIIGKVSLTKRQATARWLKEMLDNAELGGKFIELIIGDWYKIFSDKTPELKVHYVPDKSRNHWKEASGLVTTPVVVCFKMAALPTNKTSLAKLASAAADPEHTAVSPIILGNDDTILDAGLVQSTYLPKKLFEGEKFGLYTYFGNTDWVRDVDDLTTNIVAISSPKFKELVRFGVQTYRRGDTLMSILPGNSLIGSRFVVWAHSTFEYKGMLKPTIYSSYHNSQLFKLSPKVTMHVDNWGEDYAREPEE